MKARLTPASASRARGGMIPAIKEHRMQREREILHLEYGTDAGPGRPQRQLRWPPSEVPARLTSVASAVAGRHRRLPRSPTDEALRRHSPDHMSAGRGDPSHSIRVGSMGRTRPSIHRETGHADDYHVRGPRRSHDGRESGGRGITRQPARSAGMGRSRTPPPQWRSWQGSWASTATN